MKTPVLLNELIALWVREDIADGDHTSLSTIPADRTGTATLLVKQEGLIAGVEISDEVFHAFDSSLKSEHFVTDGAMVSPGDVVFSVRGPVRSILMMERLVLNIMQRMSGIATQTRKYVELVSGTKAKILDTRKTTPGFRLLEKEAVRLGGGINHRFGLYDMILIKDNHIDFSGGIEQAIDSANRYLKDNELTLGVEVETRTLDDVDRVLVHGGVQRILLDNFSVEDTRRAVKLIEGRVETESSGGINELTIRSYADCGVDYISVGALTHSVPSLDISLDIS